MFYSGLIRQNKGSLTVEAAIALPLFMCVFLSIAFFMRVGYIQNNVQNAINGAANELSTYSYLYSVSGLQSLNDEITESTDKYGESASENMTGLLEVFDSLGNSFQGNNREDIDVNEFESLYDDSVSAVEGVLEGVKNEPEKEFISVAALFVGAGYENIKSELSEPVVRFFMRKYINENILNSQGGPGAYIAVGEGENPLRAFEFDNRIFSDNKSIDIVVSYKIETVLPINVLPEIHIKQRATVRGWMDGDASPALMIEEIEKAGESVWDQENFKYGSYIKEQELKKYESGEGEDVYDVRSINLYAKSYQNISVAKSSIRGNINKLYSETKDNEDITSRTLIVVVPEGALTEEAEKMFEELKEEAADKKPAISIIEKEGYGTPKGH
ncbi:TadE/TadG family type IV pilus assembly protein [Herbivorax sp. ANBcel31]|uniref:TadE/TadG family type IV pilus assembly protein n=1 Tax=Herbivorax sp. ANBcel31 TaxID=3069754 RepID=UPI0027B77A66|nr:TadE/TadG family type IV pilus assembly protein [Herbivorax sp. ANBcel31]MDQ2085705.1 TadE/TadG family type IV pilus assembly protein [Herbivorax sp. ANBcel31]